MSKREDSSSIAERWMQGIIVQEMRMRERSRQRVQEQRNKR